MPAKNARGFTLLEMILAIVIASTVAMMGIHFMRPTGQHSRQKACDLTRQTIQLEVGRYHDRVGSFPRRDLRELADPDYFPNGLPECPAQGGRYLLQGTEVVCPLHEATRTP